MIADQVNRLGKDEIWQNGSFNTSVSVVTRLLFERPREFVSIPGRERFILISICPDGLWVTINLSFTKRQKRETSGKFKNA